MLVNPRCLELGFFLVLVSPVLVACTSVSPSWPDEAAPTSSVSQPTHEMLNATLWQRTSGEYEALARQAYRAATANLEQALREPSWSAALEQSHEFSERPPAIILDLDETVLDNTAYAARIILEYGQFNPTTFAQWCSEAKAAAVPGARDFLRYAEKRGVTVFYVTARPETLRSCTLKNLRELRLPVGADSQTLQLSDGTTKSQRRSRIANAYRILLIVGDNLDDFLEGSRSTPLERKLLAEKYATYWGSKWIVLPNPIYGHWEAAFYGFGYAMPHSEQARRKYQALQRYR